MNFGTKLTKLRKKEGLSQEELGEKLNVTRQTISKWELGQSKPDTDKLKEICNLFNADMNTLVDEETELKGTEIKNETNKISVDEPKPRRWLLVLLIVIALIIVVILLNKIVIDKQEKEKNNSNSWGIFEVFRKMGFGEMKSDFDKNSFNSDFTFYVGTKYGSNVSDLIDEIITNNKTNKEHLITVVYNNEDITDLTKIKNIKNELSEWNQYEVSEDYDDDGYINKITIESKKGYVDEASKRTFNFTYETSNGTQNGFNVKNLLDDVITNNKTNKDHILNVMYKDTNTTDVEIIKNLKSNFDEWTKYEISLDYDENGYINQITIED